MKRTIPLFVAALLLLIACSKDKQPASCTIKHIPTDYRQEAKSLIPVNTQNFWLYTDSVFNTATGVDYVESTLIKIESVSEIKGLIYFEFSSMLPPMTLAGDTLLAVTTQVAGDCYLLNRILFPVSDSVQLGDAKKWLYPDSSEITTIAGNFSDNIVYVEEGALKMLFHPGIGLIRLETRLADNKIRRSLTLKEYNVK